VAAAIDEDVASQIQLAVSDVEDARNRNKLVSCAVGKRYLLAYPVSERAFGR
jgi:hypothetical protein